MILPLVMHRPVNPYLVTALRFASSEAYHEGHLQLRDPMVASVPNYSGTRGYAYGGWIPDDIHFHYEFSDTRTYGSGANTFSETWSVKVSVDDVFLPRPDDVILYPKRTFCEDSPAQWTALGSMTIEKINVGGGVSFPPRTRRVVLRANPQLSPVIDVYDAWPSFFEWGGPPNFQMDKLVWRQNKWELVWSGLSQLVEPAISSRPPLRIL